MSSNPLTRAIRSHLERRALKQFVTTLPRKLYEDYQRRGPYTPEQVESTIRRHMASRLRYAYLAVAIYCDLEMAKRFWRTSRVSSDFERARFEIASAFFNGNVAFTERDVELYVSEHSASSGGANSSDGVGHHHGSGDFGGGHH